MHPAHFQHPSLVSCAGARVMLSFRSLVKGDGFYGYCVDYIRLEGQ
jgi:hypothetical protein